MKPIRIMTQAEVKALTESHLRRRLASAGERVRKAQKTIDSAPVPRLCVTLVARAERLAEETEAVAAWVEGGGK